MIEIRAYTSEDKAAWDDYVERHTETTVFHRAGWKRVIEHSMGYSGHYLMALDDGRIVGLYPFFVISTRLFGMMGISLPFVGYGGIVSDSAEVERLLTAEAESLARSADCSYIELRQRYPLKITLPGTDYKTVSTLDINGESDQVFSKIHSNVRNKIRKAEKSGVSVDQGLEYVSEFYDIYSRNLRDLGTPVITRQFFETAVDVFPESIRIYRAVRDGKTIAAKMVLIDKDVCYFVWSASIREALCYAPVHAMNWTAIEDACKGGCTSIDFGRSTAESSHQDFKKYWGVETHALPWAYQLFDQDGIPGLHKEDKKFSAAIALWKRLPLGLSRLLGPPIARQLP